MAKPDPIPKFIDVQPVGAAQSRLEGDAVVAAEKLDWVDQFLADREIRPNTAKMYTWQLRRFQRWLEFKHWAEVSEDDLTRYKNHLKTKPTRNGGVGLKPASVNQALASIQSFFKWLCIRRYISFNPALTIELAILSPPAPKDMDIATIHELDEGLAYRGKLSIRDTAIVGLLKHGLRAAEIGQLNTENYHDQSIQVLGAKWGSDGLVPLAPDACFAIDIYLVWAEEQDFDMSVGMPLFRSLSNRNYGDRLSYRATYNLVKDLGAIAQIEESIHPHRYRHTFGTQLVNEDISPAFAQKLMRNRSAQAFDRYTREAVTKKATEEFRKVVEQSKSGLFNTDK